ncbi:MAG: glycoside hydrolase, partial [Muribaculaceae bacterium]
PPVYYTVRGLGFREFGDAKKTILKADKFDDFAKFLANVVKHFKEEGIKINYISPLNEPQWDWSVSAIGANNSQEGSPWTNEEIRDVVRSINSQFVSDGVDSKIFISEAGSINTLLEGTGVAYDQLNKLWDPSGSCFIGQNLNNFSNIISSHSYWADGSAEALVNTRQSLKDRMTDLGDYQYWQTEYSLLGSGYKFGFPNNRMLTPMESGVSLARVIHHDLSIANATGWQWWTTFELGKNMNAEDRFALMSVAFNKDKTQGIYRTTKLLYTLGNYSRFIRPGMKRIDVSRSDNATDIEAVSTQMVSAYYDEKTNNVVMVVVNASAQDCGIKLNVENLPNGIQADEFTPYITTDLDSDNIKRYPAVKSGSHYVIPGTSVVTFVSKANALSVEQVANSENKLIIYPNPVKRGEEIVCKVNGATRLIISDINGREISRYDVVDSNSDIIQLSSDKLDLGFYIITSISKNGYIDSKKIVVKQQYY